MVRLFELAARRRLGPTYLFALLAAAPMAFASCYSTGDGTGPPPLSFYFPVAMVVSKGGNVLYVVNSDFDLQWNGGTVQSYDLYDIRIDAAASAAGYSLAPALPFPEGGGPALFLDGGTSLEAGAKLCPAGPPLFFSDGGLISPCAPYINAASYVRDSVTIGAFATDLQLSPWGNRLYAPVRGDASLTWLTVVPDVDSKGNPVPPARGQLATDADGGSGSGYAPFALQCGQAVNGGRCDATHHAGVNPNEPGNTRNLTLPGEPFAMAQTPDGTAIVITHQSEGDTSLFLTGFSADGGGASPSTPSMQFVVDAGLPLGGDGIASVPHDPAAYGCDVALGCTGLPRPAFVETNNTAAQLNLIRYYDDDGTGGFSPDASVPDANVLIGTTLQRPFITVERTLDLTILSSGTDSRGIAIDGSARLACEHLHPAPSPLHEQCARIPAQMFFANRAPATLVVGTVGGPSATDPATYDADALSFTLPYTLDQGPSRVYLAPIVNGDGDYELRVFVVCFDGSAIDIFNPGTGVVEAQIAVGQGPFAMAFDPWDPLDVALGRQVPSAPPVSFTPAKGAAPVPLTVKKYRFAYVASFTNSFVQVIDLDNSQPNKATFESIVYTLGTPSVPVGNQ